MSSFKRIIKLRDDDLEVNSEILSFYSPVFRKMFANNKSYIVLDKPSDRIKEFIKFFHPEEENNIVLENNVETIEMIMELGREFETSWLRVPLENHILCMKKGGFYDSEFYNEENCTRNIKGLLIAQKFEMHRLRDKLLNFNYCSLDKLKQLAGFSELNKENAVQLAMKRIPHAVDEDFEEIISRMCKDILGVVKKEESDGFIVNGIEGDLTIRCKKGKEIKVHSLVLKFHATNVNIVEKEIHLNDFYADDVKTFLKFLYANQPSELTDKTDYEELLKLAETFHIQWLTNHIEDFLILHNKRVIKPGIWGNDEEIEIKLLKLADVFRLIKLRNYVFKNMKKPTRIVDYTSYKDFSVEMKYLVMRKSVIMHPLEVNDGDNNMLSTEGKDIVQFLDKYLR